MRTDGVVVAWTDTAPAQQRRQAGSAWHQHKRGNRYLRTMLIHSARAAFRISEAKKKPGPFSCWVRKVAKRRGRHKVNIAIANKMARIGWAVLAKDLHYDPQLL